MEEYEFGKRVYKQVIVDGKKVGKWVVLIAVEDWNEGRLIHRIDSSRNHEEWNEFDENGNRIHGSTNQGMEYWREYDTKGGVVSHKNNKGLALTFKNKYNSDGKIVFSEISNGETEELEYDEDGRLIYTKHDAPSKYSIEEHFYEYSDEFGDRKISEKKLINGELKREDFYERDDKKSWVHKKSIWEDRELNFWADCEYDENGKLTKKLIYRGM